MRTHLVLYRNYQDMLDFNEILKNSIETEILEVSVDGLVRYYQYNSEDSVEMKLIYCEGIKDKVLQRLGGEGINSFHYLEGDYDSSVINFVESRRMW